MKRAEMLLGHDIFLGRCWSPSARVVALEAGGVVVGVVAAKHDIDV
jgi:hypothetical protein